MRHPMIAQRVFNTPLLVDPAKGHAFLSGLGARLVDGRLRLPVPEVPPERAERAGRIAPHASILGGDVAEAYRSRGRRLFGVRDGIAIIEATGTLVHRGSWIGEASGVTSYEGLAAQVDAAVSDPDVRGIALEIDSFGGEVAGAFDLADAIRAARAHKPVWAFVAESALSAGYALASQADRIILPRTGEVGSIGVLAMHIDASERLADEGVAVTLIHAGAHKVDGNPFEPLPEAVRNGLQAEVESIRDLFATTVAAGRAGRISAEGAIATQARTYRGGQAVAAGLADEVADLRAAFAAFAGHLNRRAVAGTTAAVARGPEKESTMQDEIPTPPPLPVAATAGAEDAADAAASVGTADPRTESEQPPAEPQDTAASAEPRDPVAAAAQSSIGRAEAAAIAEVGALAARLGIAVDVARAIREGATAEELRARVLEQAAARSDAADVAAVRPAASAASRESPVVAAAKRAAAEATQRRH